MINGNCGIQAAKALALIFSNVKPCLRAFWHQINGTEFCTKLTVSRFVEVLNHRFELVQILSILYQCLKKRKNTITSQITQLN